MQFSIGKMILKKINSKTGFQNRKPDFRFSINIPTFNKFNVSQPTLFVSSTPLKKKYVIIIYNKI